MVACALWEKTVIFDEKYLHPAEKPTPP